jgi:hypothetical protein
MAPAPQSAVDSPRDWGRRNYFYPSSAATPIWACVHGRVAIDGYRFRKDPTASEHVARVDTRPRPVFGGDYTGKFRLENSPCRWVFVRLSGLDFLHFYGFGNETSSTEDDDFYKVKHTDTVGTSRHVGTQAHHRERACRNQYSKTDLETDRLISDVKPYGTGDFSQVGAGAGWPSIPRVRVGLEAGFACR